MHDKTKCFSFFAMYVMQPYMHLCVAHIKAESSRRPHSELGAVVWTMNRSVCCVTVTKSDGISE